MNFSKDNFSINDIKAVINNISFEDLTKAYSMRGIILSCIKGLDDDFKDVSKMLVMFELGRMSAIREIRNKKKELVKGININGISVKVGYTSMQKGRNAELMHYKNEDILLINNKLSDEEKFAELYKWVTNSDSIVWDNEELKEKYKKEQ